MRKAVLSLCFVIISGFLFAGCTLPWNKSVSGLQVQMTDSSSAQVFLDENHLGQTPLENQELKPGVYQLKIQSNSDSTRIYETRIRLYPGSLTSVLWSFSGTDPLGSGDILELEPLTSKDRAELSVITVPEGASVSLNNVTQGLSPVLLDSVAEGDASLTIQAVAHAKKTLAVNIKPGFRLHVFSRVEKEEASPTPEPVATGSATLTPPSPAATTTTPSILGTTTSSPTPTPTTATLPASTTTPTPPYVTIKQTETGWLRVRDQASSAGQELAKVNTGTKHPYKSTLNGWYEIEYTPGKTGWISGQYAEITR